MRRSSDHPENLNQWSFTGQTPANRLSQAFRSPVIGMAVWDESGAVIEANEKFLDMVGYTRDDLDDGRIDWRAMTPPEYGALDEQMLKEMAATGVGNPIEKEYIRKDGQRVPVLISGAANPGDALGGIAFIVDLTEIRRAEVALEDSQQRFAALFENSPDIVALTDLNGKVLDINRVAGGCRKEDVLGAGFADFLTGEQRDRFEEARRLVLETGTRQGYEAAIPNPEGQTTHWFNRISPIESRGEIRHLVINCTDVTDKVLRQKALQESESRFRTIAENSADAILLLDPQGICLYANQAAHALLEYAPSELVTTPFQKLIAADERQPACDLFHGLLDKGRTFEETQLIRRDGTCVQVDINAVVLPNGTVYASCRDITRRKQAELERQRFEAELRHAQKLEAVGRLAAGIAHEINTPIQFVGDNMSFLGDAFGELTTVLAACKNLLAVVEAGDAPHQAAKALAQAIREADPDFLLEEVPCAISQSLEGVDRVAKIVRAMKEFSYRDSEQLADSDINAAIQSTITISRNEWKYVADLEAELDPTLPMVPCVLGELNQVVLNLIVNAAHAIAEVVANGDSRTPSDKRGKITIRTTHDADYAQISIEDTGAGIPPRIAERVFDPFFTTKEVGTGSGQGLTIARKVVVEKHKGQLTFCSEPGAGTTFTIRLPLRQDGHPTGDKSETAA